MNKITLIVVDCQYDFIRGSLAVKGAEEAVVNIKKYIEHNKESIDKVIFTLDWHLINHCSFKTNGGIWPVHCIQHGIGASIDDRLLKVCEVLNVPYDFILKGDDASVEEYGAFSIHCYENCLFDKQRAIFVDKDSTKVVCGIAGDYCVKETIKNLLQFLYMKPKVFLNGIASIDGGITINDFIEQNNLEVVE